MSRLTDALLLQVSGLSVAYDGREVLHDIELGVPAGQLLCVLGPSGGGKSTLLRAVAGLEEPRAGRVRLGGRDLAGVPAHERGIGLMFQDYALFPHRDVGDNVAFGLRMQGAGRTVAHARVRELLELVGLAGAERRSVAQLSGGEQQRVALARALAPRPRLLMLDEPMGSLDRSLRERLPEELRGIFADLGLTTIYVTHDQDEALSIADRVVVLDAGRLVADGTPEALWRHPPSAWLARFLGFRNVAVARLAHGRLETPWGVLPREAAHPEVIPGAERPGASAPSSASGAVTVVLRAAGLVAAADGPIRGTVTSRHFRGDHVLLMVEVADAPTLQVEARVGEVPSVGEAVSLRVLPGSAHLIGPGTAPADAVPATGMGTTAARRALPSPP
ncbi:MAG TPA: ABC transporter ATP-binding protein [Candidatus Limnocylindrales bacterium]|nr:ABC transporter ATP-binding protein [Candidatus Limnocylindrales bacterium]